MRWVVIILILFVCAFLLVGRIYTKKGKKGDELSQMPDEGANDASQADADE